MQLKEENFPLTVKDHLVSNEEFTLVYDGKNKMLVTKPHPEGSKLIQYYESDQYISHTDSKKGVVSFLYHLVKNIALKNKLNLISSLKKNAQSILDIGAGTGDFLNFVSPVFTTVIGVEPNQKARELARQKGVLLEENLKDIKEKSFDVITMWHVLEHMPNLEETIQKIETLLKPNGILLVAVPNFNSFDAAYYKDYWAAFDVPRHLWHFSKTSMNNFFSSKLLLQKIRPMIFDSFYVSILSEKNKSGKLNLFKAFLVGLRSNISAWSTKEYSSLIYCYKKPK
jgi:SAM-dependent methyltransferase